MNKWHNSQRGFFSGYLWQKMKRNKLIRLITADLGYKQFDKLFSSYPRRCINVGASEMLMLSIAVGMAYSGYIPVCYSITPFLLLRPYEIIRTYVNHEKLKVILIGSGRNDDYASDGYTHYAGDDAMILSPFTQITKFYPQYNEELNSILDQAIDSDTASYINLAR